MCLFKTTFWHIERVNVAVCLNSLVYLFKFSKISILIPFCKTALKIERLIFDLYILSQLSYYTTMLNTLS